MNCQIDPNYEIKMNRIYKEDKDLSIQDSKAKEKKFAIEIKNSLAMHLGRLNSKFLMFNKFEY